MKRVAAVDADGVFIDYRLSLVREIARALGKPVTDDFVARFNRSVSHLTDTELLNKFSPLGVNLHRLLNSDEPQGYAATALPYPDAIDAFKLLKANGFHVSVVTARTERMREVTEMTFERYGLMKFIDKIRLRGDENMSPALFKGETARQLNATHVFEDTLDNLHAIRVMSTSLERAYLIDRPWNARQAEDELYPTGQVSIERMDSFHHAVMDAIAKIEK